MHTSDDDPYQHFAEQYDRFEGAFDQHDPAEVVFFREIFQRHAVRRVLDCACGTGHHLHLCSMLEVESVGSDISSAMLAQAQKNLDGVGLTYPLYRVDYRELPQHFEPDFDALLCLRSSILHMPDEAEVLKAFQSMHAVLHADGILVLHQGTSDCQWNEKPRFILAVNEPDFTRLFVIDYEEKGARYNILDIQHGSQASGLQTFSVEYPNILLKDAQEKLLLEAGFQHVQAYGSFRFEPYDKAASRRLILIAVK